MDHSSAVRLIVFNRPLVDLLGNAVAFLRRSPYIVLRPSSEEAIFLLFGLLSLYGILIHSYAVLLSLAVT